MGEKIYNTIGRHILGEDEDRIETKLFNLLLKNKYTLSVAESCTGGLLSSTLVSIPGISESFIEGIVTYSNKSKINRLGVREDTLKQYGAVSKEVAEEMVMGLKNTDIAISTTGIAGPDGGTEDKPVGLVYVGIRIKDKVKVFKFNLLGDRDKIRKKTVLHSLFEVYKILEEDE